MITRSLSSPLCLKKTLPSWAFFGRFAVCSWGCDTVRTCLGFLNIATFLYEGIRSPKWAHPKGPRTGPNRMWLWRLCRGPRSRWKSSATWARMKLQTSSLFKLHHDMVLVSIGFPVYLLSTLKLCWKHLICSAIEAWTLWWPLASCSMNCSQLADGFEGYRHFKADQSVIFEDPTQLQTPKWKPGFSSLALWLMRRWGLAKTWTILFRKSPHETSETHFFGKMPPWRDWRVTADSPWPDHWDRLSSWPHQRWSPYFEGSCPPEFIEFTCFFQR